MKKKNPISPIFKAIAGNSFASFGNPIDPNIMGAIQDSYWNEFNNQPDMPHAKPIGLDNSALQYKSPAEELGNVKLDTGSTPPKKQPFNYGNAALMGLLAVDALLPKQKIRNPIVQPAESYNPNMYGTGSQAIGEAGISIEAKGGASIQEAKDILKAGTAHGRKLTKKQKEYFGIIASGKKAAAGANIAGDPPYKDKYYEANARLSYYKNTLNDKLKSKNPKKFIEYFKGMQQTMGALDVKNPDEARRNYVQNSDYNDFLSPEEVRGTLGNQFDDYINSLKEVNQQNVTQGQQPLYGNIEGENDPSQLNYGRRFASLQVVPSISNVVQQKGQPDRVYKRNYNFDPSTNQVDFSEEGDQTARPSYLKPKNLVNKMESGGPVGSDNVFDGGTYEFQGPSHADGGIPISYGGNQVEVEGGETAHIGQDGTLNIMGNMKVPGTNTKFKAVGKKIAKQENTYSKLINKGQQLEIGADPNDSFDALKLNTAKILQMGGTIGHADLSAKKETLTTIQNAMLAHAESLGLDPISFSEGGKKKAKNGMSIKKYASGGTVDPVHDALDKAAAKYGLRPSVLRKLVQTESGGSTRAISKAGAMGAMQFMPATAAQYGITKEQLTSADPKDIEAVVDAGAKHFKSLLDNNHGDTQLALAAYNGGQGAVDYVKKKLKNSNITGQDWLGYMQKQRETNPSGKDSAWQNQTFDYVNTISGTPFDNKKSDEFNSKYYDTRIMGPDLDPFTFGQYKLPKTSFNPQKSTAPVPYNPDAPDLGHVQMPSNTPMPSNAKGLGFDQVLPELYSLATNAQKPVFMQSYKPQLFQDYQVDFQDRRNSNTNTFNSLQRIAGQNPTALGTLAAQKYDADNNINAEQFRTNQGIQNDVTNKNVSLLNDAMGKNLGLADQQYVRQSTAASNTKEQNQLILNSLTNKNLQNNANNQRLKLYENLYDYRFRNNGQAEYLGPDASINVNETGNQTESPYSDHITKLDANGNVKQTTIRTPSPMKNQKLGLDVEQAQEKKSFIPSFLRSYNRSR